MTAEPPRGIQVNLDGAIGWAERDVLQKADQTNPYYSLELHREAIGFRRGLVMARQILTGVRR